MENEAEGIEQSDDDSDAILPTVGGAVAKVAGEATSKAGILTEWYRDRCSPSERLKGEWSAEKTTAKIEAERKRRRSENLAAHAEWVMAHERPQDDRSDSTESHQLAFDWLSGIQDVDPSDEELAAIWRSLFADVNSSAQDASLLVESAKKLTPISAKFMVRREVSGLSPYFPSEYIFVRRGSKEESIAGTLEGSGLLTKAPAVAPYLESRMLSLLVAAIFVPLAIPIVLSAFSASIEQTAIIEILKQLAWLVSAAFVVTFLIVATTQALRQSAFSPTWAYLRLRELALRHLADPRNQAQNSQPET